MKKLLAITTGLSLLSLSFVGASVALAHSDNSGPGSSGDAKFELRIDGDEDVKDLVNLDTELRIRNDGEVRIKDGKVVKIGSDMFDVSVQGMTFMAHIMPDTQFEEESSLSDLMVGDMVDVRGDIDSMNPHLIHVSEVEIENDLN